MRMIDPRRFNRNADASPIRSNETGSGTVLNVTDSPTVRAVLQLYVALSPLTNPRDAKEALGIVKPGKDAAMSDPDTYPCGK